MGRRRATPHCRPRGGRIPGSFGAAQRPFSRIWGPWRVGVFKGFRGARLVEKDCFYSIPVAFLRLQAGKRLYTPGPPKTAQKTQRGGTPLSFCRPGSPALGVGRCPVAGRAVFLCFLRCSCASSGIPVLPVVFLCFLWCCCASRGTPVLPVVSLCSLWHPVAGCGVCGVPWSAAGSCGFLWYPAVPTHPPPHPPPTTTHASQPASQPPPPGKRTFYRCMDGGTGGLTKKRARQETGLKSSARAAKNEKKAGRSAPPLKTKTRGAALRAAPTKTKHPRARGPQGHLTGPAQRPFSRIWGPFRVGF